MRRAAPRPRSPRVAARARRRSEETSLVRLQEIVSLQRTLLGDASRNAAFRRALRARLRAGSAVLDIGAGTGIWSILAARMGAGRVVAVEREPLLRPVIERLARENGVARRVEVLTGDSRRLQLPRTFDLVISETVGDLGFDEGIVEILRDARTRFLKPGGQLLPQELSLWAVPVAGAEARPLASWSPRSFGGLAVHFPFLPGRDRPRALAPPALLRHLDLRRARSSPSLEGLRASWPLREVRRVDAIAVFVTLHLAPGIELSTFARTHWSPTLYGIEPFDVAKGVVEFELALARPVSRWRVSCAGPGGRQECHYSPLFAYGSLRAALARRPR